MLKSTILVTGGAGYIGSHTSLALLNAGYSVIVLDNLSNSTPESLLRVQSIAGHTIKFWRGDIRDKLLLDRIFLENDVDAVINFAGLKSVGDSVNHPLKYFNNNVYGSIVLLQAMQDAEIRNFVFSSSATVYGDPLEMPISEACPVNRPTNPYGRSKLITEDILQDLSESDPAWRIAILRYFNPVGAHESGLIGEDPDGIPNNLLPYISHVAVGRLRELSVFGADYPTVDGTGVRDYIHVCDLAEGHLAALSFLDNRHGLNVWNLGTGTGYSVFEMIEAFQAASGRRIPFKICPRRPGDIATCFADPSKARLELGWSAKRGLKEMMEDAWRWQSMNPNGYKNS